MYLIQHFQTQGKISPQLLMLTGISLFVGTAIWGIVLLLWHVRRQGWQELLSGWGVYLVCILALALPQLFFWTFGQVSQGGFVRGYFNWGNQGDPYAWFYLKNIGAPLLLIFGGICACGQKRAPILPVVAGRIDCVHPQYL